jgi:hypothetical protein
MKSPRPRLFNLNERHAQLNALRQEKMAEPTMRMSAGLRLSSMGSVAEASVGVLGVDGRSGVADGRWQRIRTVGLGTALHVRGHLVGAAPVSGLPNQRPRSRLDAFRLGCEGRPQHPVPLGAGLRGDSCGHAPAPGAWTRLTSRSKASGLACIAPLTALVRLSTSAFPFGGTRRRPSASSARHWHRPIS